MSNPNNVDWLIARIHERKVGLCPDHRYRVSRPGDKSAIDCDAQVYWLEDEGLVCLRRDGGVTLTPAGIERHRANRRKPAVTTVAFQSPAGQAA